MPRPNVPDPVKFVGKLGVRETLSAKYGFEIVTLDLTHDNEATEDLALRCLKHTLVLEGGTEALVLRKHKDTFIHEVGNMGLGVTNHAMNALFEVIEYNKTTNRLLVYIRSPCNYLNQRVPAMHAFNIAWGKNEIDNPVKLYWDHRTTSNQLTVNQDNTIGCPQKPDIVLGCNGKGELVLVSKDDTSRRLVFKDLFASLTWRLNHRLSTFRLKNLTSLKKAGFMKDWMEPGTSERKMPGRSVAIEIMGRVIHELINFGEGYNLVPGDGYFGSRIDRCSQHELELVERKDEGESPGAYNVLLTFKSDMFEKCSLRVNTQHKAIQYIASQFFEVSFEVTWPQNLMFDITKDKSSNSHFIHHVLKVEFTNDADTAKDDPTLPVLFEQVIPEDKDIKYIRDFNQRNNTRFSEYAYFIKWIGKMEHSFDVKEGKLEDDQDILIFWNHRGRNQMFCVEETQQALHPMGKFELAWGCRNDSLKLVKGGSEEMIRFSNISTYLNKQRKVDAGRMKEIASMSRTTNEWDSPVVMAYGVFGAIMETALVTQ